MASVRGTRRGPAAGSAARRRATAGTGLGAISAVPTWRDSSYARIPKSSDDPVCCGGVSDAMATVIERHLALAAHPMFVPIPAPVATRLDSLATLAVHHSRARVRIPRGP